MTRSGGRWRSPATPWSSGATASPATPPESTATRDDNSAPLAGAAYVFVRNGTTWSQQAYLKASNTDAGDAFGYSVAVSGDTVVVGAYAEVQQAPPGLTATRATTAPCGAGAAYVFVRNGATWSQQAYLKASNTERSDTFGISVAVSGDTVVVGAALEASNATGINGDQTITALSGRRSLRFHRARRIMPRASRCSISRPG